MLDELESWKPVVGYVGFYDVSNCGNVRRPLDFKGHGNSLGPGKCLKPIKSGNGYLHVTLLLDGVQKAYSIHRLVMAAFEGDRPRGWETNHINGDKRNNRLTNLEYVSASYNSQHAIATGLTKPRRGEEVGSAKLNASQVLEIRRLRGSITIITMAKLFNVNFQTISKIHTRDTWSHLPEEVVSDGRKMSSEKRA